MAKTDITYECTMEGNYMGKAEGTNTDVQKAYSVKCTMTQAAVDKHGVLSTWKSLIGPGIMERLYSDFQHFVTYRLAGDAVCSDPNYLQDNIHLLGLPSLKIYVKNHRLPIRTQLYTDAESLRRAIINQEKDPKGYQVTEALLVSRHGANLAMKDDLERANEDIIALNKLETVPAKKKDETPSVPAEKGKKETPAGSADLKDGNTVENPGNVKTASAVVVYQRHTSKGGANYYTDPEGNKITKKEIPDDATFVDVIDKEDETPATPLNKEI